MNFRVDRWSAVALRSSLVVLTTVSALLLSSCGGGGQSSQSKRFDPARMVVFGDESSLLLPGSTSTATDGLKYTNNGFDYLETNSKIDCRTNPIWVQQLAARYDLVFAECNPLGATVTAQMRAKAFAKVEGTDGLVAQVDAFLASTPGNTAVPTDLLTIMIGTHDILELYNSVKSSALTQGAAVAEVERRARVVGAQIGRLTNYSNKRGRLIYATVPEVGLTPFGLGQSLSDQALLNLLTTSFNEALRLSVDDNGRSLGFINVAQTFRNVYDEGKDGDSVGDIINVTEPVCGTEPVLSCDPSTLVDGGTFSNYLWAGDLNFSYAAHDFIGNDAVDLATSLPW